MPKQPLASMLLVVQGAWVQPARCAFSEGFTFIWVSVGWCERLSKEGAKELYPPYMTAAIMLSSVMPCPSNRCHECLSTLLLLVVQGALVQLAPCAI